MDLKDFGVYLSKLREREGYKSQRQLAIRANISAATLSRIEAGIQKPQPETLMALSNVLDTSYYELLEKAGYISQEAKANMESFHSILDIAGIKKAQDTKDPEQITVDLLTALVKKYNLDLSKKETLEKIEAILSLVLDDHTTKK